MKEFQAHVLFGDGRSVEGLAKLLKGFNKPGAPLNKAQCDKLKDAFKRIGSGCDYLNLSAAKQACDDIIDVTSKDSLPKAGEIQSLLIELNKRIEIELKAHAYLCIPKEDTAFYKTPVEGWKDAIAAFPSATFDIEEASKCLALQRNTACVFHLMRVMGAGITALGKSLEEPTLDASHNLTWGNILRRCTRELSTDFKKRSPVWQSDSQFFAEATAKLLAAKDAWRNPNAHEIGQKYEDEETMDIYQAVRSLMRRLSKKLKES